MRLISIGILFNKRMNWETVTVRLLKKKLISITKDCGHFMLQSSTQILMNPIFRHKPSRKRDNCLCCRDKISLCVIFRGYLVEWLVEALCNESEGRGFETRWHELIFFLPYIHTYIHTYIAFHRSYKLVRWLQDVEQVRTIQLIYIYIYAHFSLFQRFTKKHRFTKTHSFNN
jgi:hypothetical protein